jgi:RNA polymerase sigma-70 factor (ECF subfamily)
VFPTVFTTLANPGVKPLGLDPDAFRAFYEDALPRIYGYLLHRSGGNPGLAEDLTQETFLAAVSELKKGRCIETPLPWVYGIARHKLLDHYRRQARTERSLTVDIPLGDDPELDQDALDTRNRVTTALAAVATSQRTTLVLHHLYGFSVLEVAGVLGKSVEAVESLLARGRASFKRAYREAVE